MCASWCGFIFCRHGKHRYCIESGSLLASDVQAEEFVSSRYVAQPLVGCPMVTPCVEDADRIDACFELKFHDLLESCSSDWIDLPPRCLLSPLYITPWYQDYASSEQSKCFLSNFDFASASCASDCCYCAMAPWSTNLPQGEREQLYVHYQQQFNFAVAEPRCGVSPKRAMKRYSFRRQSMDSEPISLVSSSRMWASLPTPSLLQV